MGKMTSEELRRLVRKTLTENYMNAMKVAKSDIESSGGEFKALGKSPFEKHPKFKEKFHNAVENPSSDEEEVERFANQINKKKEHENKFGVGKLNEEGFSSEGLQNDLQTIESLVTPGLPFVIKGIKGGDEQGPPYAEIEIMGDQYKIWDSENGLWVEPVDVDNADEKLQNPFPLGDAKKIADEINVRYSILAHMNESSGDEIKIGYKDLAQDMFNRLSNEFYAPGKDKSHIANIAIQRMMNDGLLDYDTDVDHDDNGRAIGAENYYWFNDRGIQEITSPQDIIDNYFYSDGPDTYGDSEKAHFRGSEGSGGMDESEDLGAVENAFHSAIPASGRDAEGNKIKLNNRVEHVASKTTGRVERFMIGDDGEMQVKVNWIQDSLSRNPLPNIVPTKDVVVRDAGRKNIRPELNEMHNFSNNEFLDVLVGDADLDYMKSENPEILEFDLMEAIYVFRHDYNEDHPFFHYLNSLLIKDNFKGSPMLNHREDLDEEGIQIYNALVRGENLYKEKYLDGAYGDVVVDESEIRSHANGRGENAKPSNFPDTLQREGMDFGKEERDYYDKKEFEEEEDGEIYYVIDNDFNRSNYPDLIGKTFETPPSFARVKLVKKKDVPSESINEGEDEWNDIGHGWKTLAYKGSDILSTGSSFDVNDESFETLEQAKAHVDNPTPSDRTINLYRHGAMEENEIDEDSLMKRNRAGQNQKVGPIGQHAPHSQAADENLQESYGDRYEQIVFMQGQEADHPLNILMQDGKDAAMDYLKQWHYPGEHDGDKELGRGKLDKTYEKDGYIMSWNSSIGYIGLVYDTENDNKIDEDSLMKRNRASQNQKSGPLGKHAPHAQTAISEDIDFAAAEREYHDKESLGQYANKKIVIKNMRDIYGLIGKDQSRIDSIFKDLHVELDNNRIQNNIVVATDYDDTNWLFDVVGVNDDSVYLEFTSTAK